MFAKVKFWFFSKRIGPDLPFTHFLLYSRRLGQWLCRKKFLAFGKGSELRPGSYAINTDRICIGRDVIIRPGSMLFASPYEPDRCHIQIGDFALIGSGVQIYVSNHDFSDPTQAIYFQGHSEIKPVIVEEGCWVGANAILLPGVRIGRNAVVGAGSVVTKSVSDHTVVAGNPARVIKRLLDANEKEKKPLSQFKDQ